MKSIITILIWSMIGNVGAFVWLGEPEQKLHKSYVALTLRMKDRCVKEKDCDGCLLMLFHGMGVYLGESARLQQTYGGKLGNVPGRYWKEMKEIFQGNVISYASRIGDGYCKKRGPAQKELDRFVEVIKSIEPTRKPASK